MATSLAYWNDTYNFHLVARVQKIVDHADKPDLKVVILDHTIFYPQGGAFSQGVAFYYFPNIFPLAFKLRHKPFRWPTI